MFIAWIKFPGKLNDPVNPGLVPNEVVFSPKFISTAGSMDFNWGKNTPQLISALFFFLYLDFVGSSITFVSLGQVRSGFLLDDCEESPTVALCFLHSHSCGVPLLHQPTSPLPFSHSDDGLD
jgi:adenine/guanine/hypoxanthine permease